MLRSAAGYPIHLALLTAAVACVSYRPLRADNVQVSPSRQIRMTFAVPAPLTLGCDIVEQPTPDSACAGDSLPEPALRELRGTLRGLRGDTMLVRVTSVRGEHGGSETLQPPRWARVLRTSASVEERHTSATRTALLLVALVGAGLVVIAATWSPPLSGATKPTSS